MDFTSMNFGDLLFALNCDRLKNKIKKIEKINKRIVQSKNGIYFNETCLKEGLHQKISNIYIYIETNFIKFKMTLFFYYFQMKSFQFSKFRFHSKGRSFQYVTGEPRTNKNTQVHN